MNAIGCPVTFDTFEAAKFDSVELIVIFLWQKKLNSDYESILQLLLTYWIY